VLDTYEKAAEPVRDWIEGRLLNRLGSMLSLAVVIGVARFLKPRSTSGVASALRPSCRQS
jgi:hypothetical protein